MPKQSLSRWIRRLFRPRVPIATKAFLLDHLRVMLGAGISIGRALDALAEHIDPKSVRPMLQAIRDAVERGQSLTESIAGYPELFPPLTRELISAGEATGALEGAFTESARALRKERELRNRIQNALLYPAIIVGAMAVIGTGVVIFILPQLLGLFHEVTVPLPLTTRALLAFSDVIEAHAATVIGVGVVVIAAIVIVATRSRIGRSMWHRVILGAWKIGRIACEVNIARMCRTLGALLATDVPIVRSLELTASTVQNVHYRHAITDAAATVSRGGSLRDALASRRDLFPATVLQMVNVGEQTGSLHTLLGEIANFYEEDVDMALRNLTTIIEPALMLIIGAAVAFFAIAVLQPMYTIAQAI